MSRQEADIIKGLKAIAASSSLLIPGKIQGVDMKAMTCDVSDLDGFTWHNVRLQALSPCTAGVIWIPEKESDVIIGRIDDSDNFCVLVYSKVEEVRMNISGKYMVANGEENLYDLVNTLLDILAQAVITTPAGPGNFALQTVQKITDVKTHFGKLLTKE